MTQSDLDLAYEHCHQGARVGTLAGIHGDNYIRII